MEAVEVDDDEVRWGNFLRVKILLDVGRTITLTGVKYWFPLQYEKLPSFCFNCGRILHEGEFCPESPQLNDESKQFSACLRAILDGRRRQDNMVGKFSTLAMSNVKYAGQSMVVSVGAEDI